jgi:hypothetical protein
MSGDTGIAILRRLINACGGELNPTAADLRSLWKSTARLSLKKKPSAA